MPTYEYRCHLCANIIEVHQQAYDYQEEFYQRCPECGNFTSFKKIQSRNNFELKGSGFYKTDYAKK